MKIVSRSEYGLKPVVTNFDRITKRKPLPKLLKLVVVHYTGVKKRYRNSDSAAAVRSVERWKPGEYNYVIDQTGTIFEQAGTFQAAHAAKVNKVSYGVLFLNGVTEPLTDAQVVSFRWLVDVLRWTQAVANDAEIVPHKKVGRTDCPGQLIENDFNKLVSK